MIAIIQRVSQAAVQIEGKEKSSIGKGLMILLGIGREDTDEDIEWLSRKIVQLRIFDDEEGKMNKSLKEVNGDILLVSQFTLHASTKKGNRPGYNEAAPPEAAIPLYNKMIAFLEQAMEKPIGTGTFGAMMQVSLINDGPVTIPIDTKNKR
ncbi:MAG: D-tyrosyl-tRNA(Tyr) deacylase [Cyanothece sp. SIO2G6]|nr:D-tyrosyl-tRNA(Tyr) deacylase [Cyanothece sp. SIO2G6]